MRTRGLYEVIVVDPASGLITENLELAYTPESAIVKVFAIEPDLKDRDPDEFDLFVRRIGDVREA